MSSWWRGGDSLQRCAHTCADIPTFRELAFMRVVGGVQGMSVVGHTRSWTARQRVIVRKWALWQERPRVVALVLAVDVAALMLSVLAFARSTITASDLLRFGLLAGMSVVYV